MCIRDRLTPLHDPIESRGRLDHTVGAAGDNAFLLDASAPAGKVLGTPCGVPDLGCTALSSAPSHDPIESRERPGHAAGAADGSAFVQGATAPAGKA